LEPDSVIEHVILDDGIIIMRLHVIQRFGVTVHTLLILDIMRRSANLAAINTVQQKKKKKKKILQPNLVVI
jgi:hypothetical protein